MITSDIFNVTEPTPIDNGIMHYEYHAYNPQFGSYLNETGDITINIETKDFIPHLSESYLQIEGRLTKSDGTPFADVNKVTLVNNGPMYLFSSIKLKVGDKDIEHVNYPGYVTTMLGLLKYPRKWPHGLNQCWLIDTEDTLTDENYDYSKRHNYIIKKPHTKGTFSFIVFLKHIFGFCEDYDNVLYGFNYRLMLTRHSDNDAIVRDPDAGAAKVTLTKLDWYIPEVIADDAVKLQFLKIIEDKTDILVAFMSRIGETKEVNNTRELTWALSSKSAPNFRRYIIVGFQTARKGSQTKNPAVFDHCNVNSISAVLKNKKYPEVDYDLSFADNNYSRPYRDAAIFSTKLMGLNELITNCSIETDEYRDLYPLFTFDVSKHVELMKLSSIELRIEAKFNENVPDNTQAYALIINDKICTFKSDGSSLRVIE